MTSPHNNSRSNSSSNSNTTLPSYRRPSYATVAAGVTSPTHSHFNTLAAAVSAQTSPTTPGLTSQTTVPQGGGGAGVARQRSRSELGNMDMDGPNSGGSHRNGGAGAGTALKRPESSWSINDAGRMGCLIHDDHPPFFTPSYLARSRHVQRLEKAWEEHVQELKEEMRMHPPAAPASAGTGAGRKASLSTSSSGVGLSKMHHAPGSAHLHRPQTVQDVMERMPPRGVSSEEEERTHPIPTRWSEDDRMEGLEVLAGGSEVRFDGVSKTSEAAAASVRSDHPMPKEVGLYYFEITVLSRGKDGLIGVGFSGPKVNLNRLPGWEPDSWAYHGDDGNSFACTSTGKPYGPHYSSQDVIGCGINFRTGNAFFTKNGVNLGTAFTNIKPDNLYPSIGLKKPGEHVRVNFGRHRFVFDIDRMMEEERQLIMRDIEKADVRTLHPPDDEKALIHNLIGQYLAHEGYVETAKAFARDVHEQQQSLSTEPTVFEGLGEDEDVHAFNRQKIRRAIWDGDIDQALKLLDVFYPRVLEEERYRDVVFRLKCRKFVEMMRDFHELSPATNISPITTKSIDSNGHVPGNDAEEDEEDEEDDDEGLTDTQQMELDDQLHREASLHPTDTLDIDMDASQELHPHSTVLKRRGKGKAPFVMKNQGFPPAVYQFGAELRAAYNQDARPQVQKLLSDVFALLAYTNPAESVVGPLLDVRGRGPIAEEVNGAVLVSLGKPPSAALEKLCAQAEALLDEVAARTGGSAGFVNVREDFLRQ